MVIHSFKKCVWLSNSINMELTLTKSFSVENSPWILFKIYRNMFDGNLFCTKTEFKKFTTKAKLFGHIN